MGVSGEEALLRPWPRYRPGCVEIGGGGRPLLLAMGAGIALFAAVFAVPLVERATGLRGRDAAAILAAYYASMVFNDLVLHPLALRSKRGFDLQIAVLFFYNELFNLLLVAAPNQPWSPLWLALALWAFKTGAWQEIDASLFALACHTVGPLLTIPVFLSRGAPTAQSVAGPVLASLVCGLAYAMLAATRHAWRRVRDAQADELARVRSRNEALERERVARDLHDGLGSTLALTASYARALRRHADDPAAIRRFAETLEGLGREGLHDLRGLLDALTPEDATVAALAHTAQRLAERCEEAHGVAVDVTSEGETERPLSGLLHLTAARVLQEALRNASQHGHARRIEVTLAAGECLVVTVRDDGVGGAAQRAGGRGLASMRQRAEELGGRFSVEPRGEGGTVLRWSASWGAPT